MKTSFVSILALASTFVGVLSAPAPAPAPLEKRAFDGVSLISGLNAQIQPYLSSIGKRSPE
jgi:hypothetical protein